MNPRPTLSRVLATRLHLLSAPLLDVTTPLSASLLINAYCLLLPGVDPRFGKGEGSSQGLGNESPLVWFRNETLERNLGTLSPISWWSSVNYSLLRLCTRKDSKRTFCHLSVIDDSFIRWWDALRGFVRTQRTPPPWSAIGFCCCWMMVMMITVVMMSLARRWR